MCGVCGSSRVAVLDREGERALRQKKKRVYGIGLGEGLANFTGVILSEERQRLFKDAWSGKFTLFYVFKKPCFVRGKRAAQRVVYNT